MQVIRKIVALLALAGVTSAASAGNLVINPATSVVGPEPSSFILEVLGTDFTDIVVGGGFDLTYNANFLTLNSVTINTALWEFAPNTGHKGQGTLTDVSFNTFSHFPTGNFLVATLGFTAKGGSTQPVSAPLTLGPSDVWSFSNLNGQDITSSVNFASKPFAVTISAVPLPPTAWLFASGLAVLGMFRLRRQLGAAQAETGGSFA